MLAEIPVVRLVAGQTGAVDAALLAGAHADGLTVLHVADGVGLGIFQGDEGHHHVNGRLLGQILVDGDNVIQQLPVNAVVVAPLLEGDAEHVLPLDLGGNVICIDLHHVVVALLLLPQDGQGLLGVAGGDDAVGNLALEIVGGVRVADVAEGGPVAVGAEPVSAPGPDVGAGDGGQLPLLLHKIDLPVNVAEGQTHGGAGRGNMLEGGGGGQAGGLLQLPHQLPGVESVQQIDVAGLAV